VFRRPRWTIGAGLLWLVAAVVAGVLAWLDYRSHPPPPATLLDSETPEGELIEFEIEIEDAAPAPR
jgi:hypothetical protein